MTHKAAPAAIQSKDWSGGGGDGLFTFDREMEGSFRLCTIWYSLDILWPFLAHSRSEASVHSMHSVVEFISIYIYNAFTYSDTTQVIIVITTNEGPIRECRASLPPRKTWGLTTSVSHKLLNWPTDRNNANNSRHHLIYNCVASLYNHRFGV